MSLPAWREDLRRRKAALVPMFLRLGFPSKGV
jgi:hypothetical protein